MAAWESLAPDIEQIIARIFSEQATEERDDFLKMTRTQQQILVKRAMFFNEPDRQPFRDVLRRTGLYSELKMTTGNHA